MVKKIKKIPILGASKIHGVGLFTRFNIEKGEFVPIWDFKDAKFISLRKKKYLCMERTDLNFFFNRYCVETPSGFWCPINFIRMSVGWYINHSNKPNLYSTDNNNYYALRYIKKGEELTINYKELDVNIDNRPHPSPKKHKKVKR